MIVAIVHCSPQAQYLHNQEPDLDGLAVASLAPPPKKMDMVMNRKLSAVVDQFM